MCPNSVSNRGAMALQVRDSKRAKYIISKVCLLLLAVSGFYIAYFEAHEYFDEKVNFQVATVALTANDIPACTFCFEHESYLTYGLDLFITVLYNDSMLIPFELGVNDFDDSDNNTHRVVVTQLWAVQYKSWLKKQCFKISPWGHEERSLKDVYIDATYRIKFTNKSVIPKEANLYFTSEENSYGAIMKSGKWFDGNVVPFPLKYSHFHSISIPKVTRYEYLKSKCIHQAYYHCLSSKFTQNTSCQAEGNHTESHCLAYSLPTGNEFEEFPFCNNTDDGDKALKCYTKVFLNLYHSDICRNENEKSCHVQEYTPEDEYSSYEVEGYSGYMFEFDFALPKSSRGKRESEYFKTVYVEYLVVSSLKLLGTVGGTLGIMIGFSFERIITWIIMNTTLKVWENIMLCKRCLKQC